MGRGRQCDGHLYRDRERERERERERDFIHFRKSRVEVHHRQKLRLLFMRITISLFVGLE